MHAENESYNQQLTPSIEERAANFKSWPQLYYLCFNAILTFPYISWKKIANQDNFIPIWL